MQISLSLVHFLRYCKSTYTIVSSGNERRYYLIRTEPFEYVVLRDVSIFFMYTPVLPIAVHPKEYMLQEAEHRCYSLRVIRYARITNDLCLWNPLHWLARTLRMWKHCVIWRTRPGALTGQPTHSDPWGIFHHHLYTTTTTRYPDSPELDNLVSQVQRVKQSDYKIIENQCARAIDDILFVLFYHTI